MHLPHLASISMPEISMSLSDILKPEAISEQWKMASIGQWRCAVTDAEVIRNIRPIHMKKLHGIYVQFFPDAIYVGKTSNFSRVRAQAKKIPTTISIAFIWNSRKLVNGRMALHIEAALTNAYVITGRLVRNKVASIHSRDVVGMRRASRFLREVLLYPCSEIAKCLGFNEEWAINTVEQYATLLKEAGDNVMRYGGVYK